MSDEKVLSRIWKEIPEDDNPFAASVCLCGGYDVYGEILRKSTWSEYLYLLIRGDRPSREQARLMEALTIALANPGPRDHSVHAAMAGGAGGSTNASSLTAALAVGAGGLGGAREIVVAMKYWQYCGPDFESWKDRLTKPHQEEWTDTWPPMEHPPGFDPHGASCTKPVKQVLDYLVEIYPSGMLYWLRSQRSSLESCAGCPLSITGVAATAFVDLGFSPDQGEMLYLLLRLPGAAVHALEQKRYGWRKFPFFNDAIVLTDDPGCGHSRA